MTKFYKIGSCTMDYPQLASTAIKRALFDAEIKLSDVDCAVFGYLYSESTSGQRILLEVQGVDSLSGMPVYNTNNGGATGGAAIELAYRLIQGGTNQCVLVCGFEKMSHNVISRVYDKHAYPLQRIIDQSKILIKKFDYNSNSNININLNLDKNDNKNEFKNNNKNEDDKYYVPMVFGNAGVEYMNKYKVDEQIMAQIAVKNHKNASHNPYSVNNRVYSLQQVQNSKRIYRFLTKLQCSHSADGAAAVILCSEMYFKKIIKANEGMQYCAVEIKGMKMVSDFTGSFDSDSMMDLAGYDMTKKAAQMLYAETGVKAEQVAMCELHDCFSSNEITTIEALQLCN